MESGPVSLDELQQEAKKFQTGIRRRNIANYAAVPIIAGWAGWRFLNTSVPMMHVAQISVVAAVIYIVWQMHRRGSAGVLPVNDSAATWLDFHKRQLERQRDAHRSAWKWELVPITLVSVVLFLGIVMEHRTLGWPPVGPLALILAIVAAIVFMGFNAWRRRLRAADKLQLQIDELGTFQSD